VAPPVHYLDNAATSFPKAPGVAAAMARFLGEEAGNPGRGGHRLTVAASRAVELSRLRVAELLGGHAERTLLGPGATFWLNTLLGDLVGPGDRVVTSALEHNAVMRPLERLCRQRGAVVDVVAGADPAGVPTPEEVKEAVAAAPTRAVVLTHASNVSGAVLPVEAIARAVRPVPVLVDAAQTAGHLPIAFDSMGVAALVASAHKGLLGPPGVGMLLLAEGHAVEPLVVGGTGSRSESHSMPELLPDRLEAGTPNSVGIVGLGEACRWITEEGVEALRRKQQALASDLARELGELPGVRLHGRPAGGETTGVLSLTLDGIDTGELAARLDREHGLLLRAGLHCAPSAHRRLGTFPTGTLRASVGPFTTEEAAGALIEAIGRIIRG